MLAQLFSLGKVGHFYYLFSILTTPGFNTVVDKQVPISVSKAVLPAMVLGYILPTILMFMPFQDDTVSEKFIAFWQFSPAVFAVLSSLFAATIKASDDRQERRQGILEGKTEDEIVIKKALRTYDNVEVDPLKSTYTFVFFTSALVHVTSVLYSWIESGKSLTSVVSSFIGLDAGIQNLFSSSWDAAEPAQNSLALFKLDMLYSAAPLVIFLMYTIWDIRKRGYVTTAAAQKAAVGVVAGSVLVGPAATYAGLWYWRESVLAGLAHSPC